MKRTLLSLTGIGIAATSICFASPAEALNLTFDSAPNGYTTGASYSESGYTFTQSPLGSIPHFGDGAFPRNGTLNWHNGGDNANGVIVRLTNDLGNNFDFSSFNLAGFSGSPFKVSNNLGQFMNFTSTGNKSLNWTGVSWVDFDVKHNAAIDNVYVDASAVPTPALLPGLIGMGVTALRKKRK